MITFITQIKLILREPSLLLSVAYTLPQSIPESKSDTSGSDTIEDEDTETSEFIPEEEDDDEYHQTEEEDEDAEAEQWYRDLGMTRDEADELCIEHLQELQDPNHPLNRRNLNVVGTSDVCMSSKQKVNDSDENLIVESDDKPS